MKTTNIFRNIAKSWTTCLILSFCLILSCIPVFADTPAPKLKVGSVSTDGHNGSTINIPITVENPGGFTSGQFEIDYNAEILEVVKIDNGDIITRSGMLVSTNTAAAGKIIFAFATDSSKAVVESGTFCSIQFKLKKDISTGITISIVKTDGLPYLEKDSAIETAVENGSLSVQPPPVISGGGGGMFIPTDDWLQEKIDRVKDTLKNLEENNNKPDPKVVESAVDALDQLVKVADRAKTEKKVNEFTTALLDSMEKLNNLIGKLNDGSTSLKLMDKYKQLLNATKDMLGSMEDIKAYTAATDTIRNLKGLKTASGSKIGKVRNEGVQIIRQASKFAEIALKHAAIRSIDQKEMPIENDTTTAMLKAQDTKNLVQKAAQARDEVCGLLDAISVKPDKQLSARIDIKTLNLPEINKVSVVLPADTMSALKENKLEGAYVCTGVSGLLIPSGALGNMTGEVTILMQKIDRNSLSKAQKDNVPQGSPVIDLDISVGKSKVSSLFEVVRIGIPYQPKNGEDTDFLSAFLLKEDGKVEMAGGKYNPDTGMVEFAAGHLGKYFVNTVSADFRDIGGFSWAGKAIKVLAGKGIINGKANGVFAPGDTITRAEFVSLLVKMMKLESGDAKPPYTDIMSGKWYYGNIAAAYKAGIIGDTKSKTFNPEKPITREDMAVMMSMALTKAGYTLAQDSTILKDFVDMKAMTGESSLYIATTVEHGLMNGTSGGKFNPSGNARRAEAAVVLYALFKLL